MKKFMKISSILALVLAVVGFVLVFTAGVVKGPAALSKLKSSLRGLDSGVRFEVEDHIRFDRENAVYEGDTTRSFPAGDVTDLDVEAGACLFTVEESADESFHLEVQGAGKYQGYISDGTLHIRVMCGTAPGSKDSECKVVLSVPKEFCFQRAELSLGAGQISGDSGLRAEQMEIELGAGEISLSGLKVETLETEVGMGALFLQGDVLESANLECAMGSIEMVLNGGETDYNYQVEAAAGNVQIGERSLGGMAGEWDMDNDAAGDIYVECAMGSIQISFAE